MARVTVVTAAKDAARYLPSAIESIRKQTFSDWRYVIVDDGSSDDTAAIAEQAAAADPRISVLRLSESRGAYAAANAAMLRADSAFLARLDADDVAHPSRLERQLAAFETEPHAVASATSWQPLTGDRLGHIRHVPTTRNGPLAWMLFFRSGLVHSSLVIRTSAFAAFGGYGDERVAEDFRLWAATIRQRKLVVVDEPLVQYRSHDGQMTAEPGARDQLSRLRIRAEHMNACGGDHWSTDDARDFRYIGRVAPFGVGRAESLILRWERAWRADATLGPADRDELEAYTAAARLRHLRHALRRESPRIALSVMAHPVRTAGAVLRVQGRDLSRWI